MAPFERPAAISPRISRSRSESWGNGVRGAAAK
jgi:hypothetical protein